VTIKHEPRTTGVKVCNKCGREKSVIAFAVDSACADGLYPSCRECQREYNKHYHANTGKKPAPKQLSKRQLETMHKGLT
jgi:hypothetical protein